MVFIKHSCNCSTLAQSLYFAKFAFFGHCSLQPLSLYSALVAFSHCRFFRPLQPLAIVALIYLKTLYSTILSFYPLSFNCCIFIYTGANSPVFCLVPQRIFDYKKFIVIVVWSSNSRLALAFFEKCLNNAGLTNNHFIAKLLIHLSYQNKLIK